MKVQDIYLSSRTYSILLGPICQEAPAQSMVVAVSCQVQGGGEHASIKSRQNVGVGAVAEKEEGGVGRVGRAGEKQWRHLGRREREGGSLTSL